MPDHDQIRADVLALVAGRLDAVTAGRMERHLAECEECARLATGLREMVPPLSEAGPDLFAAHPDAARIEAWALESGGQTDPMIALHVGLCPACELETRVWRRRAAVGLSEAPGLPAGAGQVKAPEEDGRIAAALSVRPRSTSRAGWLVGGLAAGIIIGLALGRLAGMGGGTGGEQPPSAPAVAWSGPVQLVVLQGRMRGEHAPQRIRLQAGRPFVILGLRPTLPDAAADDLIYRVVIRAADRRDLWETSVTAAAIRMALADTDILPVAVPADALLHGIHDVIIEPPPGPEAGPILSLPIEVVP